MQRLSIILQKWGLPKGTIRFCTIPNWVFKPIQVLQVTRSLNQCRFCTVYSGVLKPVLVEASSIFMFYMKQLAKIQKLYSAKYLVNIICYIVNNYGENKDVKKFQD